MNKWLFIDSGPLDPVSNMQVDKVLFNSFLPQESMPVFRLYLWRQPAISLGKFQQPSRVLNLKNCRQDKVKLVKRITGGSAIYHSPAELTYSLVCPSSLCKAASVKESYKKLTRFLITAYKTIGLNASYAQEFLSLPVQSRPRAGFCLSQWQECDILINQKKIGGNAQKRKKGVIFQHGSIPFEIPAGIEKYFFAKEAKGRYLALEEVGFNNRDKFKQVLIEAVKSTFAAELIPVKFNLKNKNREYAANFN